LDEQKRIRILGGLLKRIDNFSPESFEESFDSRLIFQKTVYLLQAFGLYLGYRFAWYISGPYSTGLTRDGYRLVDKFEESPDVTLKKELLEARFDEFLRFLGDRKNDAKWLETLASIHFLKSLYLGKRDKEIMHMILEKQPYLTNEEFNKALAYLEQFGLLG